MIRSLDKTPSDDSLFLQPLPSLGPHGPGPVTVRGEAVRRVYEALDDPAELDDPRIGRFEGLRLQRGGSDLSDNRVRLTKEMSLSSIIHCDGHSLKIALA